MFTSDCFYSFRWKQGNWRRFLSSISEKGSLWFRCIIKTSEDSCRQEITWDFEMRNATWNIPWSHCSVVDVCCHTLQFHECYIFETGQFWHNELMPKKLVALLHEYWGWYCNFCMTLHSNNGRKCFALNVESDRSALCVNFRMKC